jgi:poly(A) polymerase
MTVTTIIQRVTAELARRFADRQLYLVGGSLRDELLGRPSPDLDFATDGRPEDTRARVSGWADAIWLVGEKYGTIGLSKDGVKIEITTFRTETYDGRDRHPDVEFTPDLLADLARRDFTINAMARNVHTSELVDPFGGQEDLTRRRLRFVGPPAARIAEDPLRLLRAVRFAAQLGFQMDPETERAVGEHASAIARVSQERLRDELDAILVSDRPGSGFELLVRLGLAGHIVPEVEALDMPREPDVKMKNLLEHTLDAVNRVPADKALRWATLLHDIAKPLTYTRTAEEVHFYRHEEIGARLAAGILERLRQPRELCERAAKLVRHHLRIPSYSSEWTDAAVRRLMYDLGEDLEAAFQLARADIKASKLIPGSRYVRRLGELDKRIRAQGEAAELARMRPLLRGEEVMALLGVGPGPRIGEVHRFLLNEQIEGRIRTREEAEAAVRERFASPALGTERPA